ncbi:hypothetical protein ABTI84_19635, partial [Acinetobacter baumannii]
PRGLPPAPDGRQAPPPQGGAAAGGRPVRLRQKETRRRPRMGRGGTRVVQLGGGVCGGSLPQQGRHPQAAQRDRRRALQPGRQPQERGSPGA